MPLIKKPQKNDVLETCSGTIYKLIANAWIHTRYPNNFQNISKKFKKRLITWLSLGHFKCDSILIFLIFSLFLKKGRRNNNIIFSKELAEEASGKHRSPHPPPAPNNLSSHERSTSFWEMKTPSAIYISLKYNSLLIISLLQKFPLRSFRFLQIRSVICWMILHPLVGMFRLIIKAVTSATIISFLDLAFYGLHCFIKRESKWRQNDNVTWSQST